MGISNNSDEWAWRKALGLNGWLYRWELNGWRTAVGGRVSHTDISKRILSWLRTFKSSPNRNVEVLHVKAHTGEQGNERADELAKEGAKLRFKLMHEAGPDGWFTEALGRYWGNRNLD